MSLVRVFAALSLACVAGGCVQYKYDVVAAGQPPAAVVKDRDLVVPAPPVRLRLRQVESRCVLLVENPTTDPITLDGGNSAIVDPAGQSRRVEGQLIAPGSYAKFVLPPLADRPPVGPAFQFGIGAVVEADPPRRAAYLDTGRGQEYWEWAGPGQVEVILSLKRKDAVTKVDVTVRRTKI